MTSHKRERIKNEVLAPIFFEAGAALYDCQEFEYSIAYLLYHLSRIGVKGLDVIQTQAILGGDVKNTAGQLNQILKEHVNLSFDMETSLEKALKARNPIVHPFLKDNVEQFLEPSGRESVLAGLRELRSLVRDASNRLWS